MTKRSKTVDNAIRRGYAVLANELFKHAKVAVSVGNASAADRDMDWITTWLDRAGAANTQWTFNA